MHRLACKIDMHPRSVCPVTVSLKGAGNSSPPSPPPFFFFLQDGNGGDRPDAALRSVVFVGCSLYLARLSLWWQLPGCCISTLAHRPSSTSTPLLTLSSRGGGRRRGCEMGEGAERERERESAHTACIANTPNTHVQL